MKQKARKLLPFLPLYLMMPGIAYLIINNYIPMAGIVVAFKQYNVNDGMFGSPWVGFENFKFLFGTSDAFIILRNTLLYNIAFIVVNNVVGILLAIILSDVEADAHCVPKLPAAALPDLHCGGQLHCIRPAQPGKRYDEQHHSPPVG